MTTLAPAPRDVTDDDHSPVGCEVPAPVREALEAPGSGLPRGMRMLLSVPADGCLFLLADSQEGRVGIRVEPGEAAAGRSGGLLQRAVDAVLEARRFGARHAVMLVRGPDGLPALEAFARELGVEAGPGRVVPVPGLQDGARLHLGWTAA
ncbi:MAG: hypothetical protein AB7V42_06355 [Thermoleophilia bacterium]